MKSRKIFGFCYLDLIIWRPYNESSVYIEEMFLVACQKSET